MGLSVRVPTHFLVPEAIITELDKRHQSRKKVEPGLMKDTALRLIKATKGNRLDSFFSELIDHLEQQQTVREQLTSLRLNIVVIACLHSWLVAVESAISYLQHSDLNVRKSKLIFCFSALGQEYTLSLQQTSRLRKFLYRELEVPLPPLAIPDFTRVE